MSVMTNKQAEFAKMTVLLFSFIDLIGWRWRYADAYRDQRCPYGSDRSLHRDRLAIDLIIERPLPNGEWEWVVVTEDLLKIGQFWEYIGGAWGGRFGESRQGAGDGRDGNHFSLEHNGRR